MAIAIHGRWRGRPPPVSHRQRSRDTLEHSLHACPVPFFPRGTVPALHDAHMAIFPLSYVVGTTMPSVITATIPIFPLPPRHIPPILNDVRADHNNQAASQAGHIRLGRLRSILRSTVPSQGQVETIGQGCKTCRKLSWMNPNSLILSWEKNPSPATTLMTIDCLPGALQYRHLTKKVCRQECV